MLKMKENLTMLMDLYELTMANGIFYSNDMRFGGKCIFPERCGLAISG